MAREISIDLQPESKKPRLDEELESESDEEFERVDEQKHSYDSDDSDFYANGLHDVSPEDYQHYVDVVIKSRGFDVPEHIRPLDCGVIPIVNLFSDWAYNTEVDQCARSALDEHNQATGKKYVLDKLVKANMYPCAGTVYYITFVAEDLTEVGKSENDIAGGGGELEKVGPSGGPLVVFQAQTYLHLPDKQGNCKVEVLYFGAKESQ